MPSWSPATLRQNLGRGHFWIFLDLCREVTCHTHSSTKLRIGVFWNRKPTTEPGCNPSKLSGCQKPILCARQLFSKVETVVRRGGKPGDDLSPTPPVSPHPGSFEEGGRSQGGRAQRWGPPAPNSLHIGLPVGRDGVRGGRHWSLRVAQPPNQVISRLLGSRSKKKRPGCKPSALGMGVDVRAVSQRLASSPRIWMVSVIVLRGQPLEAHRWAILGICSSKGASRCRCPASDPCNPSPQVSWMCDMLGSSGRPVKLGAGVKPAGAGDAVAGQREGAGGRERLACNREGRGWCSTTRLHEAG